MLLFHTIPVTPYQQNCSIIYCDQTFNAAIIDAGGDIDLIIDALNNRKIFPNVLNVEKIILTHGHLDHCGQAPILAKRLNIPIIGPHIDDQFWLDLLPTISQNYQSKGFLAVPAFTPSMYLNDGDVIHIGNEVLDVYHTPGHTPGHVVLHHAASQHIWVGDVIFQGSIGRTDFPRGDFATLMQSIFKLFELGDLTFFSGHGEVSTFLEELDHNRFLTPHRDLLLKKLKN